MNTISGATSAIVQVSHFQTTSHTNTVREAPEPLHPIGEQHEVYIGRLNNDTPFDSAQNSHQTSGNHIYVTV